jgi:hypothetical protein
MSYLSAPNRSVSDRLKARHRVRSTTARVTLGGKRHRSIMAAHPVSTIRLSNVLNARVAGHVEAETRCHRAFRKPPRQWEWFDVGVVEAVEYIHPEIDWYEVERENLGAIIQHIARARLATLTSASVDAP